MRDIAEAAKTLMYADSATLLMVAERDPSMVRDVAAALISRMSDPGPGCGSIDCVNHCASDDHTHATCPRVMHPQNGDDRTNLKCDDDHGCGENPCICR